MSEKTVKQVFPNAHIVFTNEKYYNVWPHISYFGEVPIGTGGTKKEAWESALLYVTAKNVWAGKNDTST